MSHHIDRFRVRCRVTERLHHEICRESKTCQIFQLISCHRARGILRTHSCHTRLTVLSGNNTLNTTCLSDHLLSKRVSLHLHVRCIRFSEHIRFGKTQRFSCSCCKISSHDKRNTSTRSYFVDQHVRLEFELDRRVSVLCDTLVRIDLDDITGVHRGHVKLNRKRTRIFHRVVENRCNLTTQTDTTETLVRNVSYIVSHEPKHGICGTLTTRSCSHDITHVSHGMSLALELLDKIHGSDLTVLVRNNTITRHLQHRKSVKRNIRSRPSIRCGRQIVRVRLSGNLKYRHGKFLRKFISRSEPFSICPRLNRFLCKFISCLCLFLDVVECVKHEQRLLQSLSRDRSQLGVVQSFNHDTQIVSTLHGTKKSKCLCTIEYW